MRNLLLSGTFFLALGCGNMLVGSLKGSEYSTVAQELALMEPFLSEAKTPAMIRIEKSRHTSERLLQRQKKASMRRDLYHLVFVGGRLLSITGMSMIFVFAASELLKRTSVPRRTTTKPLVKN